MVVPNNNVRGLSAVANAFMDRNSSVPRGAGFSGVAIGDVVDCDGNPILTRNLVSDGTSILEPLEARQMMSVSMNDAGFTTKLKCNLPWLARYASIRVISLTK